MYNIHVVSHTSTSFNLVKNLIIKKKKNNIIAASYFGRKNGLMYFTRAHNNFLNNLINLYTI